MAWGLFNRTAARPAQASPGPDEVESQVELSLSRDVTAVPEVPETGPGPSDAQISAITNLLALQLDASRRHENKIEEISSAIAAVKTEFHAALRSIRADHEASVQAIRANHDADMRALREDQQALRQNVKAQIAALETTVKALSEASKSRTEEVTWTARILGTPAQSNDDRLLALPDEEVDFGQYLRDVSTDADADADAGADADVTEVQVSPRPVVKHTYWKDRGSANGAGEASIGVGTSVNRLGPPLLSSHTPIALASGSKRKRTPSVERSAVEGPTEGIPLVDDSDADSDFIENGGPSTPARRLQTDDLDEADQPIGSGRPRRSTSKRKDYHSHPLDGVINRKGLTPKRSRRDSSTVRANDSSPLRGHDRRSGASGAEPYSAARRRPRASRSQTSDAGRDQDRSASKGRGSGKVNGKAATAGKGTGRRRTFNGRVTMNDQTLKASDGDKRGNGTWPAKGENTVKGNVQEIECDVCNGRVHWACAGFEDNTIAPDEWQCPDCKLRLRHGIAAEDITSGPRDRCLRWNCVKKDHKKIQLKEGDENEYVVNRFIGRRAVGRNLDKTRIFEYLVDWHGWALNTATWEPGTNFAPTSGWLDDFLRECRERQISTKPRVVLLPDALQYFDPQTGKNLNGEDSEEEEEEEEEEEGVEATQTRPGPAEPPVPLFLPNDEE